MDILFSTCFIVNFFLVIVAEDNPPSIFINPGGDAIGCQEHIEKISDKYRKGSIYDNPQTPYPKTSVFGVLPGYGWDNLRNEAGAIVSDVLYKNCRLKNNDKYLIPDNVLFIQNKQSNVDQTAEIYKNFDEYKSATSRSVNVGVEVTGSSFSVSGSFSHDYQQAKTQQHDLKTAISRIQTQHKFYKVLLDTNSPLNPGFKSRLLDIVANFQVNNTDQAEYLSDMLVRDFGTHVITKIQTGAQLIKEDSLSSSFISSLKSNSQSIKAAATASYMAFIKVSTSVNTSKSNSALQQYNENTKSSKIQSFGGPAVSIDFDFNDWISKLERELVAIDREGEPIYNMITPTRLPEIPDPVVYRLSNIVSESVKRYYNYNTYVGCTKRDSNFFNFAANVHNDQACDFRFDNLDLGGMYQRCREIDTGYSDSLCKNLQYVNLLTNNFTCPENYTSVHLLTQHIGKESYKYTCRNGQCGKMYSYRRMVLDSYWCAGHSDFNDTQNSFLFGGLYTRDLENFVTGTHTCPPLYYPFLAGQNIWVCGALSTQTTSQYAVSFGGFYTCGSDNPFTSDGNFTENYNKWQQGCPPGYMTRVADIVNNCEIKFCTSAISKNLPKLRRPPFIARPPYNLHAIETLSIEGYAGNTWKKNMSSGEWTLERIQLGSPSSDTQNVEIDNSDLLTSGAVAGLVIGVLGVLVIVAIGVATFVKKRKRKRILPHTVRLSQLERKVKATEST